MNGKSCRLRWKSISNTVGSVERKTLSLGCTSYLGKRKRGFWNIFNHQHTCISLFLPVDDHLLLVTARSDGQWGESYWNTDKRKTTNPSNHKNGNDDTYQNKKQQNSHPLATLVQKANQKNWMERKKKRAEISYQ